MTKFSMGIDAVNIERAKRLSEHFVSSYYHENEINRAQSIVNPELRAEYLASRFAAKEAFCKAMGTGVAGNSLREIETAAMTSGKPFLVLHGSVKSRFHSIFGAEASTALSLTHEPPLAIAIVQVTYEEAQCDDAQCREAQCREAQCKEDGDAER